MKRRKPCGVSRRALIAGVAAAPLLGVSAARPTAARQKLLVTSDDPSIAVARRCLALHRENKRLHRRWGTVEAWLIDEYNWFKLTEAQQRSLPEAQRLYDISDRFAVLSEERPRAMRQLRRTPATTVAGVTAKLQVIAASIEPDEFPSAYRLLVATIGDLRAMTRR